MTKRTLLTWVMILAFGISSLPVLGFSMPTKQTGNTESTSKKPKKKKKGSKKHKKVKRTKKSAGKKYSKKKYSKKKYSKKKKSSKKYGKKKKSSKRKKSHYRKSYTPPTNSNNVEYRNYKRSGENENTGQEIAPQKEIRKEPKKEEGDNQ